MIIFHNDISFNYFSGKFTQIKLICKYNETNNLNFKDKHKAEGLENVLYKCPKCGSDNIDKLQRITGYLVGTTERWNKAKLAELNDRVIHK